MRKGQVPLPAKFVCRQDGCNTPQKLYRHDEVIEFFRSHSERHGTQGIDFEAYALVDPTEPPTEAADVIMHEPGCTKVGTAAGRDCCGGGPRDG